VEAEGALVDGAVVGSEDGVSVAGSVTPELGASVLGEPVPGEPVLVDPPVDPPVDPEDDFEALGAVEGDPSAPDPPSSGWHPVITTAADAATIAIITLLRMPFLYRMISPDCGSYGSRPSPTPTAGDRSAAEVVLPTAHL